MLLPSENTNQSSTTAETEAHQQHSERTSAFIRRLPSFGGGFGKHQLLAVKRSSHHTLPKPLQRGVNELYHSVTPQKKRAAKDASRLPTTFDPTTVELLTQERRHRLNPSDLPAAQPAALLTDQLGVRAPLDKLRGNPGAQKPSGEERRRADRSNRSPLTGPHGQQLLGPGAPLISPGPKQLDPPTTRQRLRQVTRTHLELHLHPAGSSQHIPRQPRAPLLLLTQV
ncbi:hypothetical protein SRHO_G00048490 [Serrasalmus rhombeus]